MEPVGNQVKEEMSIITAVGKQVHIGQGGTGERWGNEEGLVYGFGRVLCRRLFG